MASKIGSFAAFAVAVIGIVFLLKEDYVLSANPLAIILQVSSFALMVWARITFGIRSFHATANTTEGGLVTKGPYRWWRHPIYAAVIYFFVGSLIAFPVPEVFIAVVVIAAGLSVRMVLEERFLYAKYSDYADYARHTKRIIPFLF